MSKKTNKHKEHKKMRYHKKNKFELNKDFFSMVLLLLPFVLRDPYKKIEHKKKNEMISMVFKDIHF